MRGRYYRDNCRCCRGLTQLGIKKGKLVRLGSTVVAVSEQCLYACLDFSNFQKLSAGSGTCEYRRRKLYSHGATSVARLADTTGHRTSYPV